MGRLEIYNVIPLEYMDPRTVGYATYIAVGYFQCFQYVSHAVIAMNRFTAITRPARHRMVMRRKSPRLKAKKFRYGEDEA